MPSPARLLANRRNALRATGPRTANGLARSSQNALKSGLFSKLLVLPSLGETAEELDTFRVAVVADLNPVGVVETELADRIALLLWRLRRVVRYESAALSIATTSTKDIPPHPDDVQYEFFGTSPLPPDAPTSRKLAQQRAVLSARMNKLQSRREAIAVIAALADPKGDDPYYSSAWEVLMAASDVLGWNPDDCCWERVLLQAGISHTTIVAVDWTTRLLHQALQAAATYAKQDFAQLLDRLRDRLTTLSTELEQQAADVQREVVSLTDQLLRERREAMTAQLYADDALIQRVARAESHTAKELDRAFALLEQLQCSRGGISGGISDAEEPTGFVLRTGIINAGASDAATKSCNKFAKACFSAGWRWFRRKGYAGQ